MRIAKSTRWEERMVFFMPAPGSKRKFRRCYCSTLDSDYAASVPEVSVLVGAFERALSSSPCAFSAAEG
jgi:hypothetical protein